MTTETIPSTIETTKLNIGNPLRNARREKFCLALVGGLSQAEAARQAGYSERVARSLGQRLMTFVDVKIRLIELRDILASQNIMSIAARKERLSQIGQANLRDYSKDPFNENTPNPGALAQVEQEFDIRGVEPYPVKIKLHDPVKAIGELNKMERVYETGTNINISQSVVNVQVVTPKARELTDKIIEGDRT